MKAVIKKIFTQDEIGEGIYQYDMFGKVDTIKAVIPDAYVGMELDITEDNGNIRVVPTEKSQGIANFLCSYVKGIGPAKVAQVTWDFYDYAMNDNIPKIKESLKIKDDSKAVEIASICKDNKNMLELYMLTNGVCTAAELMKIYDLHKEKASSILRNNPYSLTSIQGFGFMKVDKIACATGVARNSIERIIAAIDYCLKEAAYQNGNCYLTTEQLESKLYELLSDVPKQAGKAKEKAVANALADWNNKKDAFEKKYKPSIEEIELMDNCFEQKQELMVAIPKACKVGFEAEKFVKEEDRYYLSNIYASEMDAAMKIKKMLKDGVKTNFTQDVIQKAILDVEQRKTHLLHEQGLNSFKATEEQKNAVLLALNNRVSVISGGPGRGKTAIAEMIAKAFELALGVDDCIVMIAPTGRASQRITESTRYPASTIHRIVGTRKCENKLIIVDESSMIDIELFAKLITWAENNTLVFLGDIDQIASIGPGKVLKDLIESKAVPYIKLIQGHRNSGSIAKNAEKINEGKPTYAYKEDSAFKIVPAMKNGIQKTFLHYYFNRVSKYGIKNVMAITPARQGALGVDTLNEMIQNELTKGKPEIKLSNGGVFRVGDRVMQTKNNQTFELKAKNKDGVYYNVKGIYNGEMGTVAKICNEGIVVLFDDGKIGAYSNKHLSQLSLAYVMTIHKCQGSEAACVIMGATFANCFLMNRNLFYTGETRAKKEIVLVGEQKPSKNGNFMINAFSYAAYKVDNDKRQTTLARKLAV